MFVTLPTFHLDRFWLKTPAPKNIQYVLVTLPTSHLDRSWLNAWAPWNMFAMSVTAETSHFDKSWLNVEAPMNVLLIAVMADTSQFLIGPCASSAHSPVGETFIHSFTADWSSSLDCGLNVTVARDRS